jgi:outer membrane protein assembly factor BamB
MTIRLSSWFRLLFVLAVLIQAGVTLLLAQHVAGPTQDELVPADHAQGDRNQWLSEHWAGRLTFDPVQEARGRLTAVDASTGEVRWRYQSDAPMVGAVTTTSGGVLFTGEVSGDFLTMDAETGEVLYHFNTGGAVAGGVISYAVEGKQYVAVMSGGMTSFWQRAPGSATVFVFALP